MTHMTGTNQRLDPTLTASFRNRMTGELPNEPASQAPGDSGATQHLIWAGGSGPTTRGPERYIASSRLVPFELHPLVDGPVRAGSNGRLVTTASATSTSLRLLPRALARNMSNAACSVIPCLSIRIPLARSVTALRPNAPSKA